MISSHLKLLDEQFFLTSYELLLLLYAIFDDEFNEFLIWIQTEIIPKREACKKNSLEAVEFFFWYFFDIFPFEKYFWRIIFLLKWDFWACACALCCCLMWFGPLNKFTSQLKTKPTRESTSTSTFKFEVVANKNYTVKRRKIK